MAIQTYNYLKLRLQQLSKDEEGATMIEYGLLAALIGVALIGVIIAVQTGLITVFESAEEGLTGAAEADS
jgi:pilus assembly protein Flp/PilA